MFTMFTSHFTRHWFDQNALKIWSDTETLQAWLNVEVALAEAQAAMGLIPPSAAETIASNARYQSFDMDAISEDIANTMHPLVPVLREFERLCGDEAAGYLHWGVTTQNIFETGLVLQLRRTHGLIVDGLNRLLENLSALASRNRDVLQAGRTHGQHALPITFGFKVAGWHAEIRRERDLLLTAATDAFVVRLGGGVGTFAAMRGKGVEVQGRVAEILGLGTEEVPVRAAFDRFANYVSQLGLIAATAQKIADEVIFLQRTEVGEVEESFHLGKVGSSTMAQKRNPSRSQNVVGLCRMLRARVPLAVESMIRQNEGDAAASNVGDVLVPEVAVFGASIVGSLADIVDGLVVHEDAMSRNLKLSGGMILSEAIMMELASVLGRHTAHHVLYDAAMATVQTGGSFSEAVTTHAKVREHAHSLDMKKLLDPSFYIGESGALVDAEIAR